MEKNISTQNVHNAQLNSPINSKKMVFLSYAKSKGSISIEKDSLEDKQ